MENTKNYEDDDPAAPWNTPFFREVVKLQDYAELGIKGPLAEGLLLKTAWQVCVINTTPMLYSNAATQVALWSIFVMQWPAITLYALFGLDETGSIPR